MAVPSGVICMWPSTHASIPAGFTRATAYDARYTKMIATSGTAPGTTGGANTHTHTGTSHSHGVTSHAHSGGTSGSANNDAQGSSTTIAAESHTVTLTAASGGTSGANTDTYAAATNEPPYFEVIFIKSDGTPAGFPNGSLAYFNATAPTGWAAHAGSDSRVMKGAAALGNGGGTGGTGNAHGHGASSGHTHTAPGGTHSHSVSAIDAPTSVSDAGASFAAAHTHGAGSVAAAAATSGSLVSNTATADNADATVPWVKSLVIENTSGSASFPKNIIAIWDGALASIPAGWLLCDGTSGTPNHSQGKYVMGTNASGSIGNTGGAATHTHTGGSHTHTGNNHDHSGSGTTDSTTPSLVGTSTGGGSPRMSVAGHTHTGPATYSGSPGGDAASLTADANSANDPLFTGVAYIQYSGAPSSPTIALPLASTTYSGTVVLSCSSTDPDGETWFSTWEYRRGAGAWTSIGTGTTVASGSSSTLSWNTDPLTNATDYEVQAKATDTGTPAASSGWTSSGTFTINYLPTVTTLNTPVSGSSYSTTIALSATLADQDSDTVTAEFEYSSNSGGAWSSIGDGTTVAAGAASTRTWDISALTPGINYRVRVRARDTLSGLSGYTSTTDFIIGPSLSALFADKNTAQYFVTKNTAQYFAERN